MKSFLARKPITFYALWGMAVALLVLALSLWAFTFPARADGIGPTETPTPTATSTVIAPANTQAEGYPGPAENVQVNQQPTVTNVAQGQPAPVIDVEDGGSFLLGPFLLLLLALVAFGAIAFLLMRRK